MNSRTRIRLGPWRGLTAACVGAALLAAPASARACDLCAIYTGSLMQLEKTGPFVGASEQYSDFGHVREDGRSATNPDNEWMKSSITQLVVGYAITNRIGVQANIPLISREYRRLEDGVAVRGDVGGLGDVSLVGRFSPLSRAVGTALVHIELLAGLKVPTGDSDRLGEELSEHDDDEAIAAWPHGSARSVARGKPRHGDDGHESAVHGHDLALGSGSVDGLLGATLQASWKRLFGEVSVQYVVRGNGDFSYEYANDLTWETGPGLYVVTDDAWTASLRFVVSGENKGRDHQKGTLAGDTAITAVYVGPGVALTWKDTLHAELAVDLPVLQDVTERQIVADYRLRAGLNWRF